MNFENALSTVDFQMIGSRTSNVTILRGIFGRCASFRINCVKCDVEWATSDNIWDHVTLTLHRIAICTYMGGG